MKIASLIATLRRWLLRGQLEQIEYQLAQIVLLREQDRATENLLKARKAMIQSDLANT